MVATYGEEPLVRRPMSWEEFVDLPEAEFPWRVEWVDGEAVIQMNAPRFIHGRILVSLASVLRAALPGLEVTAGSLVRMSRSGRIPDIMVTDGLPDGWFTTVPPVIAVEILSPSTRREDLVRKYNEYAAAGIAQYWVVDAEEWALEVFELVDGQYASALVLDRHRPEGSVRVGEHGEVALDLTEVLGPRPDLTAG